MNSGSVNRHRGSRERDVISLHVAPSAPHEREGLCGVFTNPPPAVETIPSLKDAPVQLRGAVFGRHRGLVDWGSVFREGLNSPSMGPTNFDPPRAA